MCCAKKKAAFIKQHQQQKSPLLDMANSSVKGMFFFFSQLHSMIRMSFSVWKTEQVFRFAKELK